MEEKLWRNETSILREGDCEEPRCGRKKALCSPRIGCKWKVDPLVMGTFTPKEKAVGMQSTLELDSFPSLAKSGWKFPISLYHLSMLSPLVLAQTQWSVTFGSENIPYTFRTKTPTAESSTEISTVLFQYMWQNKDPPEGRGSERAGGNPRGAFLSFLLRWMWAPRNHISRREGRSTHPLGEAL